MKDKLKKALSKSGVRFFDMEKEEGESGKHKPTYKEEKGEKVHKKVVKKVSKKKAKK